MFLASQCKMCPWRSFVLVILLQAVVNKGSPTWPYGKYTLLKPRTGCPAGWHDKGYIYQDTLDKNPSNNRSETLHIDGEVACSHVKRYFCSKTNRGNRAGLADVWPPGKYCVYRHFRYLRGMRNGSILMYGEKIHNKDEYKFTKFRVNTKWWRRYQYMRLYFACKISGNKKIPISLPITKPFYLLPYGSRDCQQVKWMVATSEWIKYHTRNLKKHGKQTYGKVPYHELGDKNHKGITMYYCYYKSCNYTLNDTKGVIQSPGFPGKYPDRQMCSWRIMVPDNHTLHVHFTNFSLSANDTLSYSKKSNGIFTSKYAFSLFLGPFALSSNSNVLFVFRSDESNTSSGFRAEYRVFIPQATTTSARASDTTPLTTSTRPSSVQDNAMKNSPFSIRSRSKAIVVIVVPTVCLLIGVVLLIVIIYQCRVRRTRTRTKNSRRETERTERSVANQTYEREAISLTSPNETATTNIACVMPVYEDIECKKPNKAYSTRNAKNSVAKKSEFVKGSVHDPLYHVTVESHEPKKRACLSQLELRESEALKDSGPNPLYHVLEGPGDKNEDQSYSESRESEGVKDSDPKPLYHVLEGPEDNDEEKSYSESRESEAVKDSGPDPLYRVLEGPVAL